MSSEEAPRPEELTILLYSSNRGTRTDVRLALGRKVASDLPPVRVVEVATQPAVLTVMDAGGIDLAILDGEAVPGGMGLGRQLKDEVVRCPPDPGVDGSGRRRVAGHLVPSGRGRAASHRPHPAARGGGRPAAGPRGLSAGARPTLG